MLAGLSDEPVASAVGVAVSGGGHSQGVPLQISAATMLLPLGSLRARIADAEALEAGMVERFDSGQLVQLEQL